MLFGIDGEHLPHRHLHEFAIEGDRPRDIPRTARHLSVVAFLFPLGFERGERKEGLPFIHPRLDVDLYPPHPLLENKPTRLFLKMLQIGIRLLVRGEVILQLRDEGVRIGPLIRLEDVGRLRMVLQICKSIFTGSTLIGLRRIEPP